MDAIEDLFVETETLMLCLAWITDKNRLPVPLPLERGVEGPCFGLRLTTAFGHITYDRKCFL